MRRSNHESFKHRNKGYKTLCLECQKTIDYGYIYALRAVGALIKILSPVGTIGMDSAPGFFSALAFGELEGAIVIAFGHLLTSAVIGFPMTIPVHLYIAFQMALWALAYRWVNKKLGLIPAVIAGIILNGVVSSFAMLPMMGMGGVLGLMPFLII